MEGQSKKIDQRGFGSDNHATVHPLILDSLTNANHGHAPSYGTDTWTLLAIEEFKKHFGTKVDIHFVFNGTAANVLCLRAAMARHEAVMCSDVSHLHHDECGAPEFFAGKVITIPSKNGKIDISEIEKHVIRKGDQHYCQPRVISITQPTELGTCYSVAEIREISAWAHKHGLFLHVDGARLTNAIVFLNTDFKTMITDSGVDLVSFGGTKNGLMYGEAIIILNPELQPNFKYLKKQSAQLPSKSRFIACQFLAYFRNDLYLSMAKNSINRSRELYELLLKNTQLKIPWEPQSNSVFPLLPQEKIKILREKYFFYVWDESTFMCRLMTSWDTTSEDVKDFADLCVRVLKT